MRSAETDRVWIDVLPRGRRTDRGGIGTRLRLYAGDMRIGATVRVGLNRFGLGRRTMVDALLLRWTNGVEQGVVRVGASRGHGVRSAQGRYFDPSGLRNVRRDRARTR